MQQTLPVKPLSDWVLLALDELRGPRGPIVLPDVYKVNLVRTGKVLATGPGRRRPKKGTLVPIQVKVGERVAFHMANLEHRQGQALLHRLDSYGTKEKLGLIREDDIFFILDEDVDVTV